MKKVIYFLFITLCCLGCKVQNTKTTTHNNTSQQSELSSTFQTYIASISGNYNSIPFKGTLRLKKDSVLWVSVSGFGFEVARLLLTQDSVFAINKLEKQVFVGNYTTFEHYFSIPLSFPVVQKVLTDTTITDYNVSQQGNVTFIPQGKTLLDGFVFPQQITIKAIKGNNNIEQIIKFSNQRLNQPVDIPFSIPQNYDTIK